MTHEHALDTLRAVEATLRGLAATVAQARHDFEQSITPAPAQTSHGGAMAPADSVASTTQPASGCASEERIAGTYHRGKNRA